ncbi:MAG: hypothetical protein AMXMBFR36_18020 [Acidobacteriota bacterium]
MGADSDDMTPRLRTRTGAFARARSGSSWPDAERRPWAPPRLRVLGELRGVTMGPSPGVGESGNPGLFRT